MNLMCFINNQTSNYITKVFIWFYSSPTSEKLVTTNKQQITIKKNYKNNPRTILEKTSSMILSFSTRAQFSKLKLDPLCFKS